MRLFIWSGSLALAFMLAHRCQIWPSQGPFDGGAAVAWAWGEAIAQWTILVNVNYVFALIFLRLMVPTPREGVYSMLTLPSIRTEPGRQLLFSCLIAVLTKARYEAPFPAFLVFHVSNIWPIRALYGRVFGPRSRSCYVTDPLILDPHLVEIGRNVVLGSGCNIAGHCQMPDMVLIRKTIIEDDVLMGANSTVFGGARIRRGAMIGAGSVVAPFTDVGEFEYWSGVPAVKVSNRPRPAYASAEPTGK